MGYAIHKWAGRHVSGMYVTSRRIFNNIRDWGSSVFDAVGVLAILECFGVVNSYYFNKY